MAKLQDKLKKGKSKSTDKIKLCQSTEQVKNSCLVFDLVQTFSVTKLYI